MTLSPFIIYLWGIADNIQLFAIILGSLLLIAVFCLMVAQSDLDDDNSQAAQCRKGSVRCIYAALCMGLLATLTPSSRTIAIMVVAPAIVNSKPIQQDLPEVYSLAVDALKQSLKDVAIEQTK